MTVRYWEFDRLGPSEMMAQEHRIMLPRIGVAAIVVNDGKLLALRRHRNSLAGGGDWSIPGGKLDFEEPLREAVLRELKEETNIDQVWTRFLCYSESFFPTELDGTPMHWITMYFVVPLGLDQDVKIMEPSKCEELRWMTPDEFVSQENLFLPNRSLLAQDSKAYHKAIQVMEEMYGL